jgi:AraC family transcriptional activator FtrA
VTHRVAVLVFDGIEPFELGVAAEVFGAPRPDVLDPAYELTVCAVSPGPLRSVGGMTISADGDLAGLAAADTVIVPGCPDVSAPAPPAVADALHAAGERGARMVGLCLGAFWLASAGLLDGREATTHWQYADELARRYPRVRVNADVLYVDEGQVLTSAGSAAGIDLCLHLVHRDHGARVVNQIGRRMVIAPHRSGGQAQFVEQPASSDGGEAWIARLIERVQGDLGRRWSVDVLAAEVHMSPRTFARKFRSATGTSPGDWVLEQRVRASLPLLEGSGESVEAISRRIGFGSSAAYRQQFTRLLGTTPTAYRRQFARG